MDCPYCKLEVTDILKHLQENTSCKLKLRTVKRRNWECLWALSDGLEEDEDDTAKRLRREEEEE